jgi:hypothetical protein
VTLLDNALVMAHIKAFRNKQRQQMVSIPLSRNSEKTKTPVSG